MVFAEATFLCGHLLLAAYMYISIKKRMYFEIYIGSICTPIQNC
jgi:hypothetical protein